MERVVKLSGGDQSKFGPGARAKVDARRNAKGSGSFMLPGADGFVIYLDSESLFRSLILVSKEVFKSQYFSKILFPIEFLKGY